MKIYVELIQYNSNMINTIILEKQEFVILS